CSLRSHVTTQAHVHERVRASQLTETMFSSGSVASVGKMEKLIEAVQHEKSLYDVRDQYYLNTKLKEAIWERIAKTLNFKSVAKHRRLARSQESNAERQMRLSEDRQRHALTRSLETSSERESRLFADRKRHALSRASKTYNETQSRLSADRVEAKKTWEKLRNNHRDALRRQKLTRWKNEPLKPWRYQRQMAFLVPYMAKRTNPNNANIGVNEDTLNDESCHSNSNTIEKDMQKDVSDTDMLQSEDEESDESYAGTASDQGNGRRLKESALDKLLIKSIKNHERRAAKRQQEREQIIANTNNDCTISNVKNDSLFHFFISMYETTKKLPLQSQLNIKTNLFSLVTTEESKHMMEMLACEHPSFS
ncbi:hypothetical protein SFRURICE_006796, partial [Spodoptera frugiperda]